MTDFEQIIEKYKTDIIALEKATGKKLLKKIEKERNKINFASLISEIKFGTILLRHFPYNLQYESNIEGFKPDFTVITESEKIIFEVLKVNVNEDQLIKKFEDYINGIEKISGENSSPFENDYLKIIAKEKKYRNLVTDNGYKLVICVDGSTVEKVVSPLDVIQMFEICKHNLIKEETINFLNNTAGIYLIQFMGDAEFIKNKHSKFPLIIEL